MGKIKSKAVKMTAKRLKENDIVFKDDFEGNKALLRDTMPSKKVRNQLAGYLTRVRKMDKKEEIALAKKE